MPAVARSRGSPEVGERPLKPDDEAMSGVTCEIASGLAGGKSLAVYLRISTQTAVGVGLTEAHGSVYQATVPLGMGDDFQYVDLSYTDFALSEYGGVVDGNGELDADEVVALFIADVSALMMASHAGLNTFWTDAALFVE